MIGKGRFMKDDIWHWLDSHNQPKKKRCLRYIRICVVSVHLLHADIVKNILDWLSCSIHGIWCSLVMWIHVHCTEAQLYLGKRNTVGKKATLVQGIETGSAGGAEGILPDWLEMVTNTICWENLRDVISKFITVTSIHICVPHTYLLIWSTYVLAINTLI